MKKILLFGCLIALILCGTLIHSAECQNPLSHRNQQSMSAIFLELTPLAPCTLDSGFYQIETMLQANNTIILECRIANSECIFPLSSTWLSTWIKPPANDTCNRAASLYLCSQKILTIFNRKTSAFWLAGSFPDKSCNLIRTADIVEVGG